MGQTRAAGNGSRFFRRFGVTSGLPIAQAASMTETDPNRRPLKSRSTAWAKWAAGKLVKRDVSPNQISLASLVFAAIGASLLVWYPTPPGLVAAALAVQLRLLCNLLDGMVAVEGGRRSVLGELYNEFPDRIADLLLIVGLGHAIDLPELGWLGAAAALGTAYVRAFGASLGLGQDFRGPMAKPHRMAAMTIALVVGAFELPISGSVHAMSLAAWVIALGGLLTCALRTREITRQLRQRQDLGQEQG